MKKLYAFVAAFVASFIPVGAVSDDVCGVADIAGPYTWSYVSVLHSGDDAGRAVDMAIEVTDASAGAVALSVGDFVLDGVFDPSAAELTLPSGQYLGYNAQNRMDVFFYHGVRDVGVPDAPVRFDGSPAVFGYDGGRFVLPPEEAIAIGNSSSGYLVFGERNVFESEGGAGLGAPVAAGDESSAPRFVTLQGVCVDSPAAPGIYIVRQGARTTKICVK